MACITQVITHTYLTEPKVYSFKALFCNILLSHYFSSPTYHFWFHVEFKCKIWKQYFVNFFLTQCVHLPRPAFLFVFRAFLQLLCPLVTWKCILYKCQGIGSNNTAFCCQTEITSYFSCLYSFASGPPNYIKHMRMTFVNTHLIFTHIVHRLIIWLQCDLV